MRITRATDALRACADTDDSDGPSDQEGEIIMKVVKTWTKKAIGEELGLQLSTIQTYLRSLYRKVGVSKKEALVW